MFLYFPVHTSHFFLNFFEKNSFPNTLIINNSLITKSLTLTDPKCQKGGIIVPRKNNKVTKETLRQKKEEWKKLVQIREAEAKKPDTPQAVLDVLDKTIAEAANSALSDLDQWLGNQKKPAYNQPKKEVKT